MFPEESIWLQKHPDLLPQIVLPASEDKVHMMQACYQCDAIVFILSKTWCKYDYCDTPGQENDCTSLEAGFEKPK